MQTVYHIALLDDEPCYTNMIRDKIEAFGLEEQLFIDTYNNVNDFLRSKHIYDILLLDIEMPGMDGIHLAKYIANEPDTGDLCNELCRSYGGCIWNQRIPLCSEIQNR